MIDIDMNTGIYNLKQSTMAITSIDKSNCETYTVIIALVIDIHCTSTNSICKNILEQPFFQLICVG